MIYADTIPTYAVYSHYLPRRYYAYAIHTLLRCLLRRHISCLLLRAAITIAAIAITSYAPKAPAGYDSHILVTPVETHVITLLRHRLRHTVIFLTYAIEYAAIRHNSYLRIPATPATGYQSHRRSPLLPSYAIEAHRVTHVNTLQ